MRPAGWSLLVCVLGASLSPSPLPAAEDARITFEVMVPPGTPEGTTVFVSGNVPILGNWNGAGLLLTWRGGRRYTGSIRVDAGTALEFKVTRGSWDTVEKDAAGREIANRTHTVGGDHTIRVQVGTWRDEVEEVAVRPSTRTGTIIDHPAFASEFVDARNVHVYLPPGYDEGETRYPVVYFHDGQNVFDAATSFIGAEWQADETAERLIHDGEVRPFIAVAAWNSSRRTHEYTPVEEASRGEGGGAALYGQFLITELKPFIDDTYRTLPGPEDTAVIGSSLGGVLSMYLGLENPDVFRLVGCVSPAAWWGDHDLAARVRASGHLPLRIWLDVGTEEGVGGVAPGRWVEETRELRNALTRVGYREGVDLHFEVIEGARHDERAWADRLDRILVYLLGPPEPD